jgi:hypothetical protein
MVTETPEELERRSRELFENSVDRLDARTRSRLHQARNVALDELKKGSTRRYWLSAPLGGLAAVVLVAVFLLSGRETVTPGSEPGILPLDDFDIVADTDNFEMLQDVEFYSWLAEQSAGESNNSG